MSKFEKGWKGGPGRPQGSRNKLGEAFLTALADDFAEHGVDAIKRVRQEDPSTYIKTVAGILPKEINAEVSKRPFEDMSDEELAIGAEIVRHLVATASGADSDGDEAKEGAESSRSVPPLH